MELLSRKDALSQGLKHYFTGKPCKHGHLSKRFASTGNCVACSQIYGKALSTEQKERNKVSQRRSVARRLAQNPRHFADKALLRLNAKRNEIKERSKDLAAEFKKTHGYSYSTYKLRKSSTARIAVNLRRRLRKAVLGRAKSAQTLDLLGCTVDHLLGHLAAQFQPGMNWDNYGEWHIDHVRPCASFDLTDLEQQRQCFHYSNLQPLWAADNLAKSDKWEAA